MDAGLHGMEFKAPGRVASTVGKRRGKPSEKPANQGSPAFLFRIVKFADLTEVKSDRLLGDERAVPALLYLWGTACSPRPFLTSADARPQRTGSRALRQGRNGPQARSTATLLMEQPGELPALILEVNAGFGVATSLVARTRTCTGVAIMTW